MKKYYERNGFACEKVERLSEIIDNNNVVEMCGEMFNRKVK